MKETLFPIISNGSLSVDFPTNIFFVRQCSLHSHNNTRGGEGKKEKKIQWGFLKSPFLPEGRMYMKLEVQIGNTILKANFLLKIDRVQHSMWFPLQ